MSEETKRLISILKYEAINPNLKVDHKACGLSFDELMKELNK